MANNISAESRPANALPSIAADVDRKNKMNEKKPTHPGHKKQPPIPEKNYTAN